MTTRRLSLGSVCLLVCLMGCMHSPPPPAPPAVWTENFSVNGQRFSDKSIVDQLKRSSASDYKATLVRWMLLDQEARTQNVVPSDTDVNNKFDLKKELDWQFVSRIAATPESATLAREEVRTQLELRRLLTKATVITPEDIQKEYAAQHTLYDTPARARCMLVAILDEKPLDEVVDSMEQQSPPVTADDLRHRFPRQLVLIGDRDIFTFVQAFGTSMNKDIFDMKPRGVLVMMPGDLSKLGAKKLVVKLLDTSPSKKADLNDPQILQAIKEAIALKRHSESDFVASLWKKAKFESADPTDRTRIEQVLIPTHKRTGLQSGSP